MTNDLEQSVQQARDIIAGRDVSPSDALSLAQRLMKGRRIGLARKVLARAAAHDSLRQDAALRLRVAQRQALCTYKDPDLQEEIKLDAAQSILSEVEDLETTVNQETLGLAGAIYKRRWEQTAQVRELETALTYYYRGLEQGIAGDVGYTAINAAFVLDQLADQQRIAGQPEALQSLAAHRQALARGIREQIVEILPGLPAQPGKAELSGTWWYLVTLGEAFFGLGRFEEARQWLLRAAALGGVPDWERESTARQLGALLLMRQRAGGTPDEPAHAEAVAVLREFLGQDAAALESVLRGRVGLALSGGGFRASLYHIGVLARLAELDLLRHVEYLSCVSGGSIIGAHYYLEVQRLLQSKKDEEIGRDDYIKIVKDIEREFVAGVGTNIRTRIAAEWWTNLKLIFKPSYSRTLRAGELYEEKIFSRVADERGNEPRHLSDLMFTPKGADDDFSPKDCNWRRSAKVPILVLNATSLNTGHNWQFTASWMGEPPAGINAEVDANYRLRRMYLGDAPEAYRQIRLGHAVAASSCVPGIFEPLSLPDLYERMPGEKRSAVRPLVRLVDGGVFDNQGTAALLEQGCSVLLVSDASGQMDDCDFPSNGLLGVPLRANSILQARVRVSQFEELASRRRGGLLKGLMFVHLKQGLDNQPVDWIGCTDPSPTPVEMPILPHGVQRQVQRRLAAIRTDLDSFSEIEAKSLMGCGYLSTVHALKRPVLGFAAGPGQRHDWDFLKVLPLLSDPRPDPAYLRQLDVAGKLFFKVWMLMRQLQLLAGVLAMALLGIALRVAWLQWDQPVLNLKVSDFAIGLALAALSALGLGFIGKALRFRKTANDVLIGVGAATLGFLVARLHLHVLDRLFLHQGRLDRLKDNRPPSAARPAP
ncbi:patatin-like phospholipase family protein [Azohydromonas caseinilytica]|uniref:Patatin family protein n=1 Tax=Azohydromonas caseinilytica TaxID=2728836 RepID=A0A848FFX9_9BURK|nr:patatin-like phospholipase family protein [Azohydromonas caseinilytica]NML18274.1 patatin family protein [Azohydromonas caseinilytica]